MDNSELLTRFQRVASERTTVQEVWDTVEEFVTPYRGRFFRDQRDEHSIEWRNRTVWDSTAIVAHQTLAASLHGALTSPATQWFTIKFRNDKLNRNKAANKWLRDSAQIVYDTLQDSSFNLEVNETYQDLAGFGTAFLTQEESMVDGEMVMDFISVPVKEAFFEENHQGQAEYFYRHLKWTPVQIVSKFGEDNVPDEIVRLAEEGTNEERIDIIYAVYPRKTKPAALGKKLAPKRRPYGFKYVTMNDGLTLGKEGGYYEMPVRVPRWRKTSESIWGNSPAMLALNDVLTLNAWVEIVTIASEKQLDPPMLAEEHALVTDVNMDARALTVVRNIDGLKIFETGADLSVTEIGIQRLQASIRNYFFNDQINFPQPQGTPMTATEAQIRYELMQRLLGPTLGRLRRDLLDPTISRTFNMLARAGKLPELPAILMDEPDTAMEMQYTGPLARAQKADAAMNTERWAASVAGIAGQVDPETANTMLSVMNGEEITRGLGRSLDVDPMMMRDPAEVKAETEKRQAGIEQAQAAQLAQETGAGMQAMAEGEQQLEQAQP